MCICGELINNLTMLLAHLIIYSWERQAPVWHMWFFINIYYKFGRLFRVFLSFRG